MTRPPRRLPVETVCHDPLDVENICLGPRHFWPRTRLDRLFCLYIAGLNIALLAVIATRIYLGGL